jgi:uncharacterized protein (TIGR03083 family)
MSTDTATAGTRNRPRRRALDRTTAMRLARTEYRRVADAVADLAPEQWTLLTDCPDWDVRATVAHIAGMASMAATPWETSRQDKAARAAAVHSGSSHLNELTALQVAERAGATPAELTAELHAVGPKAARGRRLTPFFVRAMRLPQVQNVGGSEEWWTIGYLLDIILTRDPWMHRIDLAKATGNELVLTADHDGVIVDDVVREWAQRHRQPYRLRLTGPAGGTWSAGDGGEELELDAVQFCRILSGRAPGEELLAVEVPF